MIEEEGSTLSSNLATRARTIGRANAKSMFGESASGARTAFRAHERKIWK